MYSKKIGRLVFVQCARVPTNVVNGAPTLTAARTTFSWTSVCKHRRQFLQLRTRPGPDQQHAMPTTVRVRSASQSTVDPNELRRFQAMANKWWDERGEFAALHSMNDLRVPFIRDNLLNAHRWRQSGKPLAGIRILDVGCGGGLLTEPLGRLGADVLGVDPVEDSIRTAELHTSRDPDLRSHVRYRACTLEEVSEGVGQGEEEEGGGGGGEGLFDAVVASEVVEHLADLETFSLCCNQVLKPGGSLFITTINKTRLSYALGIVAAEQVLRVVPSGTHEWDKFISPEDLERLLESNGFNVQSIQGMLYNPLSRGWSWIQNTSINYALHAVKQKEEPYPDPAEAVSPDRQDHTETAAARHNN